MSAIAQDTTLTDNNLLGDILASESVSIQIDKDSDHAYLRVTAPSAGRITVLAVDDNPDMVHFYRRSTAGTRYHIVHSAQGEEASSIIATTESDIIMLDVMLPDIDGWRLLMRLCEDPVTRSIPTIVCSVVKDEELALSLGAARYPAKPVRRLRFESCRGARMIITERQPPAAVNPRRHPEKPRQCYVHGG
jgi:CheY-like chemotaxis protein